MSSTSEQPSDTFQPDFVRQSSAQSLASVTSQVSAPAGASSSKPAAKRSSAGDALFKDIKRKHTADDDILAQDNDDFGAEPIVSSTTKSMPPALAALLAAAPAAATSSTKAAAPPDSTVDVPSRSHVSTVVVSGDGSDAARRSMPHAALPDSPDTVKPRPVSYRFGTRRILVSAPTEISDDESATESEGNDMDKGDENAQSGSVLPPEA
jgi:hypothetical protein